MNSRLSHKAQGISVMGWGPGSGLTSAPPRWDSRCPWEQLSLSISWELKTRSWQSLKPGNRAGTKKPNPKWKLTAEYPIFTQQSLDYLQNLTRHDFRTCSISTFTYWISLPNITSESVRKEEETAISLTSLISHGLCPSDCYTPLTFNSPVQEGTATSSGPNDLRHTGQSILGIFFLAPKDDHLASNGLKIFPKEVGYSSGVS